jgi:hypothetical protein
MVLLMQLTVSGSTRRVLSLSEEVTSSAMSPVVIYSLLQNITDASCSDGQKSCETYHKLKW